MRIDAISRNPTTGKVTLTVARGCVDTPAIPHKAGDQVWDYDGATVDLQEFSYNSMVGIRAVVHTSLGDGAPNGGYYTSVFGRAARPYHGADFRLNGYPRDATPNLTGDLTFTWKHRNRITQSDQLVGELESDIAPEPNTYYGVFLNRENGPGVWFLDWIRRAEPSFKSAPPARQSNTMVIPASALGGPGGPAIRYPPSYKLFGSTTAAFKAFRSRIMATNRASCSTMVRQTWCRPMQKASTMSFDRNFGS
jgi:hypothetical protein